jgi:MATE family multidrug resistance protein
MSSLPKRRAAFATEARATLILAIPLIIGQLCSMGQGVVETMLAGHVDAHTLGAVAIGANLFVLPVMAVNGVMMAVPAMVAQLDGAGRRGEVAVLFRQSLWLCFALGLALALVTWLGGGAVISAIGAPAALAEDVGAFLSASALGLPAIALYFTCRGLATGLSRARTTMVFALLGLVLLVPVGSVLVYGGFGLPPLGATGCGLAGAVVNWIQAIAFRVWLRFGPDSAALRPKAGGRWPDSRAILAMLRLGLPMAGSILLEVGAFSFASLAISRFGAVAAASYQVALNVVGVTFMVPLGLSMAMTVRVGLAAGRRDTIGARLAGLAGLAIVLLTQTLSAATLVTAPRWIAALYTPDAAVTSGAAVMLLLAGLFQFSDGIQVAASGALRGLKDTRVPMAICLVAYWGVAVPLGLALAFGWDMRAPGMWIGLIGGLTAAAVLLFARFMRLTRPARVREAVTAIA